MTRLLDKPRGDLDKPPPPWPLSAIQRTTRILRRLAKFFHSSSEREVEKRRPFDRLYITKGLGRRDEHTFLRSLLGRCVNSTTLIYSEPPTFTPCLERKRLFEAHPLTSLETGSRPLKPRRTHRPHLPGRASTKAHQPRRTTFVDAHQPRRTTLLDLATLNSKGLLNTPTLPPFERTYTRRVRVIFSVPE